MKALGDLRIKERSVVCFLIIVLSVVGVGIIGYVTTDKVYKAAETVYGEKMPIVEAATSASLAVLDGRDVMGKYLLNEAEEEREKLRNALDEFVKDYHMWHHAVVMGTDSDGFKKNYGDRWSERYGDKRINAVPPGSNIRQKFTEADEFFVRFLEASRAMMLTHDTRLAKEDEKKKLVKDLKNSRMDVQNIIFASNDEKLKVDFLTMKYKAKEYIFQYQDKKHEAQWLEAVSTLKAGIASSNLDEASKGKMLGDMQNYEALTRRIITLVEEIHQLKAEEIMHMDELDAASTTVEAAMSDVVGLAALEMEAAIASAGETRSASNKLIILVTVMAAVLALLIGRLLADSVTNPLKDLNDGAGMIARGDLTKYIKVKTRDEIGELASAFRTMTKSLRDLVSKVQISAQRVAGTSQELAASSEEMAASTSQVSSTIQQIASGALAQSEHAEIAEKEVNSMAEMVYRIARKAEEASEASKSVAETARIGGMAVKQATAKMNEIHVVVNDSAEIVKELGERSHRIGEIVSVITNIAEQTNLLALNAAIEAARAGEHGRGFAVVAEEVRKLAESSARAAEEISDLINSIQSETSKAVESMEYGAKGVADGSDVVNKALTSLEEIIRVVNTTIESVQEISGATKELSAVTETIVGTMEEIAAKAEEVASGTEEASAATVEQASSMEEISALAQELASLAGQLQEATSKFKLNGNGYRARGVQGRKETGSSTSPIPSESMMPLKAQRACTTAQNGGTTVNEE